MKIREITEEITAEDGSAPNAKKRKALGDMSVDEMFSMINEEEKKTNKKTIKNKKRKKNDFEDEDKNVSFDNAKLHDEDKGEETDSDEEEHALHGFSKNVVNAEMLAEWAEELRSDNPLNAFLHLREALTAAILSIGKSENESRKYHCKYEVIGSNMFNAVIRLCLRFGPSAFYKILQLKSPGDDPTKCKRWTKMMTFFKSYLVNIMKLVGAVAEPAAAEMLLSRGILPLLSYYAGIKTIVKKLLRKLISLWSTNEKKVRVLAFICIFRLTRLLPKSYHEWILSGMYKAYVQNCKYTSQYTWGVIDFMRLSLVELYALDESFAYKQGFVYIRQMAIQLRNAIQNGSQERIQAVYNWQYMHCLHLWAELLSKTHPSTVLQPLLYPLVQVAIGTVQLRPVPSFYPVVFHICDIITDLSRHTGTFIPVLPHLLEVLLNAPLQKQHKKATIKPFNWKCMLRVSAKEMEESGFKDGIVAQVYGGIINYLSVESNSIAFPELAFPVITQINQFVKQCKVPNYNKKMKQLVEKVKENCNFIETHRRSATLRIDDTKAVKDWEISVRQEGPPLYKFYQQWKKIQEDDYQRQMVSEINLGGHELPVLRKEEVEGKKQPVLPESDISEEESSTEIDSDINLESDDDSKKKKRKRQKKKKKKNSQQAQQENDDDDDDHEVAREIQHKKISFDDLGTFDEDDELREMNFSDDEVEKDDYGAESD